MSKHEHRLFGLFAAVLGLAVAGLWFGHRAEPKPATVELVPVHHVSGGNSKVLALVEAAAARAAATDAPSPNLLAHAGGQAKAVAADLARVPAELLAAMPDDPEAATDAPDPTLPLAARFTTERTDTRWTGFQNAMRDAMSAAITSVSSNGSRLISTECRTTLCRTEVELASPPMVTFIDLGNRVQQDPLMASVTGRYHLDGNRAVIYTAPPGVALE